MFGVAVDPVNLLFDLLFIWLTYASGYGKFMWAGVRSNNFGFRWPKDISIMGMGSPNSPPMTTSKDRLK
jgi:hypothetical protein